MVQKMRDIYKFENDNSCSSLSLYQLLKMILDIPKRQPSLVRKTNWKD